MVEKIKKSLCSVLERVINYVPKLCSELEEKKVNSNNYVFIAVTSCIIQYFIISVSFNYPDTIC